MKDHIFRFRRGIKLSYFNSILCFGLNLVIYLALIYFLPGCTTYGNKTSKNIQTSEQSDSENIITSVNIEDNLLRITTKGTFKYKVSKLADPFRVMIELEGVGMGKFKDGIVSNKEGISEITFVSRLKPTKATIVDMLTTSPSNVSHSIDENTLTLTIEYISPELLSELDEDIIDSSEETEPEVVKESETEKVSDVPGEEKPYKEQQRVSLDFQDADIIGIFRLLADVSGYNIITDPDVKGKITMKLKNVPWEKGLDLILRAHNLDKRISDNIIRIAPVQRFIDEDKQRLDAIEKKPLNTRIFEINYKDIDEMKSAIEEANILSTRGKVTVDKRASVLIVNDVENSFPKVQKLIELIDREDIQVRQVLIEARIVEIDKNYAQELGIAWGYSGAETTRTGDTVRFGGVGPVLAPGEVAEEGIGSFAGSNFIVNLPAAIGAGSGGAIGFGFINALGTRMLDMQLSALESKELVKIISNPRVLTMNNEPARIEQGITTYIPTATADKIEWKEINALLSLDVTPTIAPGGAVILKIKLSNDEMIPSEAEEPSKTTNHIATKTMVHSGETVVIGGVYKKKNTQGKSGVPWVSDIPLLGWLFKTKSDEEVTVELDIFITPKVIEYSKIK